MLRHHHTSGYVKEFEHSCDGSLSTPSAQPTGAPTSEPTQVPTAVPTAAPTGTPYPTPQPSPGPTLAPTTAPTKAWPTPAPTVAAPVSAVSFVLTVSEPPASLEAKLQVYKVALAETLKVSLGRIQLTIIKAASRRLSGGAQIAVRIAAANPAIAKQAEKAVEKPAFVLDLVLELKKQGEIIAPAAIAPSEVQVCGGLNESPCKVATKCLTGYQVTEATSAFVGAHVAKISTCIASRNQRMYKHTKSYEDDR